MARTALRGRLTWQIATVGAVMTETASARTLFLDVPGWAGHQAGQHVDLRLTAEDGYMAERSYSIASAPGEPLAITVERLDDGEVSPYLTEEARAGDQLEVRGPIGGYFVWEPADGGPLLLYSARSLDDVIYRREFDHPAPGAEVIYTLTRRRPAGWPGYARRVDPALLAEAAWPPRRPLAYVCGPTRFVETVSQALVAAGYPEERVRTERFGSTGGT